MDRHISITVPEQQQLMDDYGITDDIITYVTDKDESANYVYDPENNQQLLIALVPYRLKGEKNALYRPSRWLFDSSGPHFHL